MGKDEISRDLDDYLRARKKSSLSITNLLDNINERVKKFRAPKPKVEMPQEVEVYDEPVPKEPKKPFYHKLFNKENIDEELIRSRMQAQDAIEDIKEISKISLKMIKELPDEHLRKFKESPEFEKLKSILKKHELIK
jgi:predicted RNA methylase